MSRLSVQIVTWNSAATIEACLDSLRAQERQDFEVVVVDNASTDRSLELVRTALRPLGSRARIVAEDHNRGFCGGQNRATALTRGGWVLFLNPDAELPPSFMDKALDCIGAAPGDVGSLVPRILLPDGRIESTGLVLDRFRRLRDRGQGLPAQGAFTEEEDVMGGTGAVILHRRAMLDDVAVEGQPLDENLFAYYDDLDLALRARGRGWRSRYVPSLEAVHHRAGRNSLRGLPRRRVDARAQALTVRNRLLVMAKHERIADLLRDLPQLAAFELARIGYLSWKSPAALRGYGAAFAGLPAAVRARRELLSRTPRVR
ncbi:MAG TPA: glycosyltransferase family 2 protein [Anaeromyxobacteraceae bacterium]|nr:glycosyltransferase family 2 protein [Anaeromyxobacteraceae bacterium]